MEPSTEDLSAAVKEYHRKGNDRVVALLHGAILESYLIICLRLKLFLINQDIDDFQKDALFMSESSVLKDFDSKIHMGYYLGIYDKTIRDDLNRIKKIRNTFAHTALPVTFDTKEIREECGKLVLHKRAKIDSSNARGKLFASYLNVLERFMKFTEECRKEISEALPDDMKEQLLKFEEQLRRRPQIWSSIRQGLSRLLRP